MAKPSNKVRQLLVFLFLLQFPTSFQLSRNSFNLTNSSSKLSSQRSVHKDRNACNEVRKTFRRQCTKPEKEVIGGGSGEQREEEDDSTTSCECFEREEILAFDVVEVTSEYEDHSTEPPSNHRLRCADCLTTTSVATAGSKCTTIVSYFIKVKVTKPLCTRGKCKQKCTKVASSSTNCATTTSGCSKCTNCPLKCTKIASHYTLIKVNATKPSPRPKACCGCCTTSTTSCPGRCSSRCTTIVSYDTVIKVYCTKCHCSTTCPVPKFPSLPPIFIFPAYFQTHRCYHGSGGECACSCKSDHKFIPGNFSCGLNSSMVYNGQSKTNDECSPSTGNGECGPSTVKIVNGLFKVNGVNCPSNTNGENDLSMVNENNRQSMDAEKPIYYCPRCKSKVISMNFHPNGHQNAEPNGPESNDYENDRSNEDDWPSITKLSCRLYESRVTSSTCYLDSQCSPESNCSNNCNLKVLCAKNQCDQEVLQAKIDTFLNRYNNKNHVKKNNSKSRCNKSKHHFCCKLRKIVGNCPNCGFKLGGGHTLSNTEITSTEYVDTPEAWMTPDKEDAWMTTDEPEAWMTTSKKRKKEVEVKLGVQSSGIQDALKTKVTLTSAVNIPEVGETIYKQEVCTARAKKCKKKVVAETTSSKVIQRLGLGQRSRKMFTKFPSWWTCTVSYALDRN